MDTSTTETKPDRPDSPDRRAGPELEFYAVRLYVHPQGFWLTLGEVLSHHTGNSWALLQCGRTETGWELQLMG